MSVHLHRGERTDGLVRELGHTLRTTPPDPFTPDIVAVPSRGIERFLAQGLATLLGADPTGGGICANVEFPSPAELVQRVLCATEPGDGSASPDSDPWRPERAVWPLLDVIDATAQEAWCRPLATHVGLVGEPGTRADRRFAVASRLASLFDSYATQRPAMLVEWSAGADTDGAGTPVPEDLLWQPELWRRLAAAIGRPSPAERLDRACRLLRTDPHLADLPDRLSVFGPSRLTAEELAVLAALAEHREIHLWIADASPALWTTIEKAGASVAVPAVPLRRRDDNSATLVANPLLRSLGRDARELHLRIRDLLPAPAHDQQVSLPSGSTRDHPGAASPPAETLLAHLQRDLREDCPPTAPGREPMVLATTDRSIQVHACHGPNRQAEVLRELVLGLLDADPSLEPRDIVVMCPDLDTMAPLISAAFSDPRPDAPTRDLRLRIADRTPEQANEVLATLDALLGLVPGRALLSEVLDLVARPPVRTRYALTDDDVERIEELAQSAGVRWGLDDRTRSDYHLAGLSTGTWQWGVDRMLLGVALSEDGLPVCHEVLPLDDVPSADVSRVGRLAELIARLQAFRDGCTGRHPLPHWIGVLQDAVTGMMEARGADAWQMPNALAALTALERAAQGTAVDAPLGLADVRWMLAELLAGRPTRMNFRSGGLTVCGLVPMRSVPHRVICLVGMDDGAFPRAVVRDGDDVLARDPRLGERDPRSEDRQVLLDAIVAATETLILTYTGADDRTNERRPPCVPLGELLDAIDAAARTADDRPAREQVVTRHPLQPFDPRNFTPGALLAGATLSHDVEALRGARAAREPRVAAPALIGAPLPVDTATAVTLVELARFLRSPAAEHLRSRLGLAVGSGPDALDEVIPLELDGLACWDVGERSIAQLTQGQDPVRIVAAERARGVVPPGPLGSGLIDIGHTAQAIADGAREARAGEPRLVPIRVELPTGRRLTGAVADVFESGIVRATYSKPKARSVVALWPELLALAVAEPATSRSGTLVCRGGIVRLRAPAPERAAEVLDQLLDLRELGTSEPLPMPPATAMAYAEIRYRGHRISTALAKAEREWFASRFDQETGERRTWGEATEPAQELVYGPEAPIARLLADPAPTAEGWAPDEETRFGALALRVWAPILAARELAE